LKYFRLPNGKGAVIFTAGCRGGGILDTSGEAGFTITRLHRNIFAKLKQYQSEGTLIFLDNNIAFIGMRLVKVLAPAILLISLTPMVQGGLLGLAGYGLCQTGCNAVWTACVAAAGGVAGVSTGGVGVPAAILACNAAQGLCMGSCAAVALSPA